MNTQEMLQGVKNYIDTQDAGLIFDISEANAESGVPATYDDIYEALGTGGANVPASVRDGGMSVKFIQQLYTVAKTTSSSAPSGGTYINSDPGIGNGSAYTAADLSAFSSLPTTSSVVYYLSDGESPAAYTVWTISKNTLASCAYVQFRYMGTSTSTGFTTITNWQGVDSTPTAGSKNLVESSGVAEELALGTVFDVTAHNNSVTFASLSALLSDANLSTLIPTSVRRGGMSIKFVQTSDNKYVQYRLMSTSFSTTVTNWQGVDDEPTARSNNLVKSSGIHNITNNIHPSLFDVGYRLTNGSKISSLQSSGSYRSLLLHVNKGEQYKLYGIGTDGARSWATAQEDGTILRRNDVHSEWTTNEITIDEGESLLVFNSAYDASTTQPYVYIVYSGDAISSVKKEIPKLIEEDATLNGRIVSNTNAINSLIDNGKISTYDNGYRVTSGTKVGDIQPSASYVSLYIPVCKDEVYKVSGQGTNNAQLWATTDEDGNILRVSTGSVTRTEVVTIEDSEVYLVYNSGKVSDYYVNILSQGQCIAKNTKNIKDLQDENVSEEESINVLYNQFDGLRKDTPLLPEISPESLEGGYYNISNGTFVSNTEYATTPAITLPKNARVSVEVRIENSKSTNPTNCGIYVYRGGEWLTGYSARTYESMESLGGNLWRFNLPDTLCETNKTIQIKICSLATRLLSNLKVYTNKSSVVYSKDQENIIEIGDFSSSMLLGIPHEVKDLSGNVDESLLGRPDSRTTLYVNMSQVYNIRFKFQVKGNVLNDGRQKIIFGTNRSRIKIDANSVPLTQQTSTFTYNGETHTTYFPVLLGGVAFNSGALLAKENNNIGEFAFDIRYTGSLDNTVTVENTGEAFVIEINNAVAHTLSFTQYPTVAELYSAISEITDFEVDYNELESRNCNELAIFPKTHLVSEYYNKIGTSSTNTYYKDAGMLHIPYAIDKRWHQAEICALSNGVTNVLVDGKRLTWQQETIATSDSTPLYFNKSDIAVVFKDIEICTNGIRDFELASYYNGNSRTSMCISSVNPMIVIWEGHGIVDLPSHEVNSSTPGYEDGMCTTPDRLELVFSEMEAKGYVPVSIYDIADWYYNGKDLPKRCYTLMFDDYRFDNYLNLKNRQVFTRHNVKPATCVISGQTTAITYNGETISQEKAIAIGKTCGFSFATHTRNHRYMTRLKPSDYVSEYLQDIYSGDTMGIDPRIVVYPYGDFNNYLMNTLKFMGCTMGIEVVSNLPIRKYANPLCFGRLELGLRENIENVLANIV